MRPSPFRAAAVVISIVGSLTLTQAVEETVRVREYENRYGKVWPPGQWPTSDGWREWVRDQEASLSRVENRDEKWFGWLNLIQSMSLRTFSENGFELVDLPEKIWRKLRDRATSTPLDTIPFERKADHAGIEPPPRFLDTTDLNDEILAELRALHEDWSGVDLVLSKAYGLRYYLNQSTLVWHLDKVETHVVSGILHIGSDPDQAESPWPLEIVGHDGKEHKVVLRPGQMLFYESAKLSHGRPSTFNGTWYTSVFLHYRPKDWLVTRDDMVYRVPPHWDTPASPVRDDL